MLFHAKALSVPYAVVIRTADTDVVVITLCKMPKLCQCLKVWLEVGLTWNNILRYINMNFAVLYLFILLSLGAILLHRLVVKGTLIH